jgi:hypothetical protein
MGTETTCACGGQLPADAAWCPRCFERRPVPADADPSQVAFTAAGGTPDSPGARAFGGTLAPPPVRPPGRPPRPGRFAKTEASFGLFGRIVCTVLLLIPLAWFIYLATQLIGIGGIVVYGGIVCPWALRDLWKRPGRG